MIIDNLLQLSGSWAAGVWTPQLVTATGATLSSNIVDTTGGTRQLQPIDPGVGEELNIAISIAQTLTSGGAATVRFQLITADDTSMATNKQIIVQTDDIPYAQLTAGVIVPLHLDRAAPYPRRRYMGLQYTISGAALTNGTGQFIAEIVKNFQDVQNTLYASGFQIQ